jgi:MYXO-CTERM domain-containing protein
MKLTRNCKSHAALLVGAGFLFASPAAHAATSAVTVAAGTKVTNTGEWAAGWEFTVSTSINVTHLGKFDYENNGIVGTAVGLYNRTTGGTLLATVSLVGAPSELSGAYTAYYTTVATPITLTPGNTYTIAAVQDGPTEAIFWGTSTATYASPITYVRGIAQTGSTLPATFTSNSPALTGTTNGYFGGTFKFDPVPEPSAALLGGLGLLALLRRRR